jgi:hypothetical protein
MIQQCHTSEPNGFQRRAAEIRRQWSPAERAVRTGLPPDMPHRLREHLVGSLASSWQPLPDFELDYSRLPAIPLRRAHGAS